MGSLVQLPLLGVDLEVLRFYSFPLLLLLLAGAYGVEGVGGVSPMVGRLSGSNAQPSIPLSNPLPKNQASLDQSSVLPLLLVQRISLTLVPALPRWA